MSYPDSYRDRYSLQSFLSLRYHYGTKKNFRITLATTNWRSNQG
jgi:hypothetical protein